MWKPSYGSAVNGVVQVAAADEGAADAVAVAGVVDAQPCANTKTTGNANAHRVCARLDIDEA
jgi:hypothetical protein